MYIRGPSLLFNTVKGAFIPTISVGNVRYI